MEEIIQDSIERVTQFLELQGVLVDQLPTFTYIDEYSPMSKRVLAQVPGELEQIRKISEETARGQLMKHLPFWYEEKGVSLNEGVLSQNVDVTLQRLRNFSGLTDEEIARLNSHGTEILFFRSIKDVLDANPEERANMILDSYLAHEIWHVIEMREGLLNSMIVEGTAEYSRITFEKWKKEKTQYDVSSLLDDEVGKSVLIDMMGESVYEKGLEIVKTHVTSLPEILVPETRTRMEKEFLDYLSRDIVGLINENDVPYDKHGAMNRIAFPEFDILDEELTHDNLLVALGTAGFTKMVAGLESQDCSLLLEEYKKMGYGKLR